MSSALFPEFYQFLTLELPNDQFTIFYVYNFIRLVTVYF